MDHIEDDGSIAFVELLTQHQRSLYGYIYTMVRNSSDSDDILQETNLVLWKKRLEYKTGTSFIAWGLPHCLL